MPHPRTIGQPRTGAPLGQQPVHVTVANRERVNVSVQGSRPIQVSIPGTGPPGPPGPPGPSPIVDTSNTYAIGGTISAGMAIPAFYVAAGNTERVTLIKLRWSTGAGFATFDLLYAPSGDELAAIVTGLQASTVDGVLSLDPALPVNDGDKLSLNITAAEDAVDLTVSIAFQHTVSSDA